jgi:hypothetical protein
MLGGGPLGSGPLGSPQVIAGVGGIPSGEAFGNLTISVSPVPARFIPTEVTLRTEPATTGELAWPLRIGRRVGEAWLLRQALELLDRLIDWLT